MQIKQNANRAASLVRQLLAFSRRQTLRPQVLDLGEVLSDLDHAAAPPDRREGRARSRARPRSVAGEGRHLAARAGDRQSRGQCARRDAERRQAHGAHRERHRRRSASAVRYKPMPAADYVLVEVERHRHRHSAGDHRARSSSRSSPPRRSARAPASASRRSTASSSRPAASSSSTPTIGKGTTLPHLPAAPRRRSPDERRRRRRRVDAAGAAKPPADLTGHGTILLVEDEEGLRGLNARGLASRGYTVLEAGNGVEAIEVIESQGGEVDLVVSDVVMPEMDGPTLLKEMRERNPGAEDDLRVGLCRGGVREEPARATASSPSCRSRSRSSSWSRP